MNSTYFLRTSDYTCTLTCNTNNGFWINLVDNPSQKMCDTCLSNCLVCTNDSFNGCIQCNGSYVLEKGECKGDCINQRSYKLNGVCYDCDYACQTCSGAGANNCVQCR